MVLGFLRDPLSSMCDREVTEKKCQLGGVPGDQGLPQDLWVQSTCALGGPSCCWGARPPAQWLSEFHLYPSQVADFAWTLPMFQPWSPWVLAPPYRSRDPNAQMRYLAWSGSTPQTPCMRSLRWNGCREDCL